MRLAFKQTATIMAECLDWFRGFRGRFQISLVTKSVESMPWDCMHLLRLELEVFLGCQMLSIFF